MSHKGLWVIILGGLILSAQNKMVQDMTEFLCSSSHVCVGSLRVLRVQRSNWGSTGDSIREGQLVDLFRGSIWAIQSGIDELTCMLSLCRVDPESRWQKNSI